jgi:hypothetical protein
MSNIMPLVVSIAVAVVAAGVLALVPHIGTVVKNHIAASSLKFLTITAGKLVMAAMEEVRNLKDPTKPGTWGPEEAGRIKARVLSELRSLGGKALEEFKDLNGLSVASVEILLDTLVEEQVEGMREYRKVPSDIPPPVKP